MDQILKKPIILKGLIILLFMGTILFSGCTENNQTEPEQTYNNSQGMEFVLIPAGEFYMGSDSIPMDFTKPSHLVTISKPFYMARYEVTQEEWTELMGDNPSFFEGDELPVEQVSWNDAQEFVDRMNEKENTDKYRLPTEAEWEYAARAGTTTKFSFTEEANDLDEYGWSNTYGWCAINSNGATNPVGEKEPNQWGLYDIYGNVWEWTQDNWHDNYEGAPADGSAWEDETTIVRIGKGGGWSDGPNYCQSAFRGGLDADTSNNVLGLRIVKEV